jgi:hypothetical protein
MVQPHQQTEAAVVVLQVTETTVHTLAVTVAQEL